MDHSSAQVFDFTSGTIVKTEILSKFTHEDKQETASRSESIMHNKEQHLQAEYYKELTQLIKKYDEVLLFGATDAKTELSNILNKEHLYLKIKIELINTDKMTDNQKDAFVKNHFSKIKINSSVV